MSARSASNVEPRSDASRSMLVVELETSVSDSESTSLEDTCVTTVVTRKLPTTAVKTMARIHPDA